jgi:CBS domain-containing protein
MKVRNIMTQPAQTCTPHTNLAAASRRMKETGCGTLAVLSAGRLAGILTDRDLAMAIANVDAPARVSVGTVMTKRVHSCRLDDDVHTVLATMSKFKVRRLPVLSSDGDVEGMISIDDIVLWATPRSAVSLPVLMTALRSISHASSSIIHDAAEC